MIDEQDGYSSGETSSSSSCATKDSPFVAGPWTPPVRPRRAGRRPVAAAAPPQQHDGQENHVAASAATTTSPAFSSSPKKSPTKRKKNKSSNSSNLHSDGNLGGSLNSFLSASSPRKSKSPTKMRRESKKVSSIEKRGEPVGPNQLAAEESSPRKAKKKQSKAKKASLATKSPLKKKKLDEAGKGQQLLEVGEQQQKLYSPKKSPKKAGEESKKSPRKTNGKGVMPNDDQPLSPPAEESAKQSRKKSPKKSPTGKKPPASHQEHEKISGETSKLSSKKSPTKAGRTRKNRAAPSSFWDQSDTKISDYDRDESNSEIGHTLKGPNVCNLDDSVLSEALNGHQSSTTSILVEISDEDTWREEANNAHCIIQKPSSPTARNDFKGNRSSRDHGLSSGVGKEQSSNKSTVTGRTKRLSAFNSTDDDTSSSDDDVPRRSSRRPPPSDVEANGGHRSLTKPQSDKSSSTHREKQCLSAYNSIDDDDSSSSHGLSSGVGKEQTSNKSTVTRRTKRLSAFNSTDDDTSSSDDDVPRRSPRRPAPADVEANGGHRSLTKPQSEKTSSNHREKKCLSAYNSTDDDDSSSSEDYPPSKHSTTKARAKNNDTSSLLADDTLQAGDEANEAQVSKSSARRERRRLSAFDSTDDDDSSSSEDRPFRKYSTSSANQKENGTFRPPGDDNSNSVDSDGDLRTGDSGERIHGEEAERLSNSAKRRGLSAFGPDCSSSTSSGEESACPKQRRRKDAACSVAALSDGDQRETHSPQAPKPPQRTYSGESTDSEPPFQLGLRPGGNACSYETDSRPVQRRTLSTSSIDSEPPFSRGVQRTFSAESTDSEPPFQLGLRPGSHVDSKLGRTPSRTYSAGSVDSDPPFSLGMRPGAPQRSLSTDSTASEGPPITLGLRPGSLARTCSVDSTDSEPPFSMSLRPGAPQGMVPVDSRPDAQRRFVPGAITIPEDPSESPGNPPLQPSRTYSTDSTDSEPPFSLSLRPGAKQSGNTTFNNDYRPGIPQRALSNDSTESEGPPFSLGLRPGQPSRTYSTDTTVSDPPFCLSLRPGAPQGNVHVGTADQGSKLPTKVRPFVPNSTDRAGKPGTNVTTKGEESELAQSLSSLRKLLSVSNGSTHPTEMQTRPVLKKVSSMRLSSTASTSEDPWHVIETRRLLLRRVSSMRVRPVSRADWHPQHKLRRVDFTRTWSSSPSPDDPLHVIEQRRSQLRRVSSMRLPSKSTTQDETENVILQRRAQLRRVSSLRVPSVSVTNTGKQSRQNVERISSARCVTRTPQNCFADVFNPDRERSRRAGLENCDGARCDSSANKVTTPACFDLLPTKRPPPKRSVSKTLENIMPLQDRVQILADPQAQADSGWDGEDLLPSTEKGCSRDCENRRYQSEVTDTTSQSGGSCSGSPQPFEFSHLRKFAKTTSKTVPSSNLTPTKETSLETFDQSQSSTNFHEIRRRLDQSADKGLVPEWADLSGRRHSSFVPPNLTSVSQARTTHDQDESMTDYSMNVDDIYEVNKKPASTNSRCHSSFAAGPTYSPKQKALNPLGMSLAQMGSRDNNESFHFAELRRIAMGEAPGYSGQLSANSSTDFGRRLTETQLPVPPEVGGMNSLRSLPESPKSPVKHKVANKVRSVGFNRASKNEYVTADALLSPRRFEKKKIATPFGTTLKPTTYSAIHKYSQQSQNAKFSKSVGNFGRADDSTEASDDVPYPGHSNKLPSPKSKANFLNKKLEFVKTKSKTPKTGGIAEKIKMLNLDS